MDLHKFNSKRYLSDDGNSKTDTSDSESESEEEQEDTEGTDSESEDEDEVDKAIWYRYDSFGVHVLWTYAYNSSTACIALRRPPHPAPLL